MKVLPTPGYTIENKKRAHMGNSRVRRLLAAGLIGSLGLAYQSNVAVAQSQLGSSFDCSRDTATVVRIFCTNDQVRRADLDQLQRYYTFRHASPELQSAARERFIAAIRQLRAECDLPSQQLASNCAVRHLFALREIWLASLRETRNQSALEEARLSSDQLLGMQASLKTAGYLASTSPVDGVYGNTTRAAISRLQAERGIEPNGFLTNATVRAIQLAAANPTASPSQASQPATSTVPPSSGQRENAVVTAPIAPIREPEFNVEAARRELQAAREAVADEAARMNDGAVDVWERSTSQSGSPGNQEALRNLAEAGNRRAQYRFGQLIEQRGVAGIDPSSSVGWYRRAAEQNYPDAQYALGLILTRGTFGHQSYTEGVSWFRRSAERWHAPSQDAVGVAYYQGLGVPRDDNQALLWFRRAALQEFPLADFHIGVMYEEGRAVNRNYETAMRFYRAAADRGEPNSQTRIGVLYVNGAGVSVDLATAVSWFRLAAEQGHVAGQDWLALMYLEGRGIGSNYSEALRWFRRSISQGSLAAHYQVGRMYMNGWGVERDLQEARRLVRVAAERPYPGSTELLSQIENQIRAEQEERERQRRLEQERQRRHFQTY